MTVFKYSYADATSNFNGSRYSRWFSKNEPASEQQHMTESLAEVFYPEIKCEPRIERTASLSAMGSCFARGLERAADRAGMNAMPLKKKPFIGPHSHPVIAPDSLDGIQARRKGLTRYFSRVFKADVFTITLWADRGLV